MSTPREPTPYERRRENEARILADIDVDAVWEHASYYCGVDCRPAYATCEETLVGLLAALSAEGPVLIVEGEARDASALAKLTSRFVEAVRVTNGWLPDKRAVDVASEARRLFAREVETDGR